jgi:hypothetical protein
MTTLPANVERRIGQRFAFNLPISLRDQATAVEGFGFTQDVSSRGAFFFTDIALNPGAQVEITLNMPSEITLGEAMRVRCKGRILRVAKPLENGESCELRPENAASLSQSDQSGQAAKSSDLRPFENRSSTLRSFETQSSATRPSETRIGVAVCFNEYEYLPEANNGSADFRRISALHETTQDDHPATSPNAGPRGAIN